MSVLSAFTQRCHVALPVLLQRNTARIGIVMGNEAADLDSVACSLVLAHFLSGRDEQKEMYFPVINTRREDLRLRTEVTHVLQRLNIDPAMLAFAPELDLEDLHVQGRLDLILVDHNRLAHEQTGLAGAVRQVIDHHDKQGVFPFAARSVIEPVGSCASLVTQELLKSSDNAKPRAGTSAVPAADVAELLLSAIASDTINFDSSKGRCTTTDLWAAEQLRPHVAESTDVLFQRVQEAKFDVAGLTAMELLLKDTKISQVGHTKFGIGSATLSLQSFFDRPDARDSIGEYMETKGLPLLLIMTVAQHPTFHRQLAVIPAVSLWESRWFCRFQEGLCRSELNLTAMELSSTLMNVAAYHQGAANKSRKVVMPTVLSLLKTTPTREAALPNVKLIGVTGGIGCGKSTVVKRLEQLGNAVVDCDKLGHLAYEPGTPGYAQVIETFGADILAEDQTVNRQALGAKVFSDPNLMRRLTDIVWPAIAQMVRQRLAEVEEAAAQGDDARILYIEAAILIKAGWHMMCDEVWVCTASQEVVKKRLMATRGHSEEEVLKRMAVQFDSLPWATRTFVTEDTVEALHSKVDAAHQEALQVVATA